MFLPHIPGMARDHIPGLPVPTNAVSTSFCLTPPGGIESPVNQQPELVRYSEGGLGPRGNSQGNHYQGNYVFFFGNYYHISRGIIIITIIITLLPYTQIGSLKKSVDL